MSADVHTLPHPPARDRDQDMLRIGSIACGHFARVVAILTPTFIESSAFDAKLVHAQDCEDCALQVVDSS